jgi:hypothetical protein
VLLTFFHFFVIFFGTMSALLETQTVNWLLETPVGQYGAKSLDEIRKSENILARSAASAVDLSFAWTSWALQKSK